MTQRNAGAAQNAQPWCVLSWLLVMVVMVVVVVVVLVVVVVNPYSNPDSDPDPHPHPNPGPRTYTLLDDNIGIIHLSWRMHAITTSISVYKPSCPKPFMQPRPSH